MNEEPKKIYADGSVKGCSPVFLVENESGDMVWDSEVASCDKPKDGDIHWDKSQGGWIDESGRPLEGYRLPSFGLSYIIKDFEQCTPRIVPQVPKKLKPSDLMADDLYWEELDTTGKNTAKQEVPGLHWSCNSNLVGHYPPDKDIYPEEETCGLKAAFDKDKTTYTEEVIDGIKYSLPNIYTKDGAKDETLMIDGVDVLPAIKKDKMAQLREEIGYMKEHLRGLTFEIGKMAMLLANMDGADFDFSI